MQEARERIEKSKHLAAQLATLDSRITQIAIINQLVEDNTKLDLVCCFEPEPDDDTTGYFWIANLLLRIDFEGLDERQALPFTYELGFQMGEKVFLPNGKTLEKTQAHTVLWPDKEETTETPERPGWQRPYEAFGITEAEVARWRVTDERLKEILASPDTTTHTINQSTNTFGEFTFLTASRRVGQNRIFMTFYGLGYHEYRERWIHKEWFWYQSQESVVDTQTKLPGEEVREMLEQRLVEISPHLGEDTQTERGQMFEQFADLTDDDAALAEMQDLGFY